MFTGIVEGVGSVSTLTDIPAGKRLCVDVGDFALDRTKLGDSIAVNGVCVTVVEFNASSFAVDISRETLACTSLGSLGRGAHVNLEHALTLQSLISGHLVTGHVDGSGRIAELTRDHDSLRLGIEVPAELMRYISRKGSVAVDGVSLTVNAVFDGKFEAQIIPHTLTRTILGEYSIGDRVNLEVDMVARYLERLMTAGSAQATKAATGGITLELLERHGFIRPAGGSDT